MTLIETVALMAGQNPGVTLLVLACASLIEYVFPPFPGDAITLAGIVLVQESGLSLPGAFLAILVGSMAGAAIDFRLGVLLARWRSRDSMDEGLGSRLARSSTAIRILDGCDKASHAFARLGEAAIVLNRFLPGIRAFLFVAAGMGGMRFARVMLFATLSAILWNGLLLIAAMLVGANLERLEYLASAWGFGGWLLVGAVAVVFLVRWAIRRHRGKP